MNSDLTETQLSEAKRYLPQAEDSELKEFAVRQANARRRLKKLVTFYEENYCRMTRLHLLAACAIALGRFCGVSETFDEIGELLMPTTSEKKPKNKEWEKYSEACRNKMPVEIRDELWLVAHFKDIENVRSKNLEQKFYTEAAEHGDEPIWQLLRQHIEVTLGVRLMDNTAIAGLIPHETAIAESLALTLKKLTTTCFQLAARYTAESFRAALDFSKNERNEFLSYRRTAVELSRNFLLSFTVSKIFRRGIRERERGRKAETENWNMLETVMGEQVSEVDPLIREFYSNPSRFDVTATLKLETLPAKFWARTLTFLVGQGLYESNLEKIPAKFNIFQRADGSMHFIRELYCDGKYRVFDADFVVKNGKLYEVFLDLKTSVEMEVSPINNGGLSIKGVRYFYRHIKLPNIGLEVEFQSCVENDLLNVRGQLMMKPKTKFGRFLAYKILRRPQNLGSIFYAARKKEEFI